MSETDALHQVPITLFADGQLANRGTLRQIAPSGRDRRPRSWGHAFLQEPLDALNAPGGAFRNWMRNPADNGNCRAALRSLREIGETVLEGDLSDVLDFRTDAEQKPQRIRVPVYTDEEASRIPIELAHRGLDVDGNMNNQVAGWAAGFLSVSPQVDISFVRHLGVAPLEPSLIPRMQPLQMLVVISNPQADPLGQILFDGDNLSFEGSLKAESDALVAALGEQCRLGLLSIHFLVGDEAAERVYEGDLRVRQGSSGLMWQAHPVDQTLKLKQKLLSLLESGSFHILHYFGHGSPDAAGAGLITRPGQTLTPADLGQQVRKTPRIMVLSGCHTALPLGNAVGQPLRSFASVSLLRGTAVLISMLTYVTPETATKTTSALYHGLTRSLFSDSSSVEEALHDVRCKLYGEGRLDFFVPLLYVRPVKGGLFSYSDRRIQIWDNYLKSRLSFNPVALAETAWLMRKHLLPWRTRCPKGALL